MSIGLHEALRQACAEAGLIPKDVPADGRWHLADVDGGGRGSGRIKLFPDGDGGLVCNWQDGGETRAFFVHEQRTLSEPERRERAFKMQERTRLAQEEDAKARAEASAKAAKLWSKAKPINGHPYLARKKVKPTATLKEIHLDHAAALLGYRPQARGVPLAGRLIVAPVKVGDAISTAELIDEAGNKSAVAGGKKAGGYWATKPLPGGNGEGLTILIGEGVATAITGFEATGCTALAALSCGNLGPVAREMRRRFPEARLVILSDLGNGEADAMRAATESGAAIAIPDFGPSRPEKASDFNDLASVAGVEAVRHAIEAARVPHAQPAQEKASKGAADYPQPKTLPVGLPPVAPFIFELLPDSLRPWAEDICDRVQCPPDFVGATILTALGSVIGRKVAIRPQGQTDWTEYANQWGLVVGRPGVLKSPAMEAALAPLKRLAANAAAVHAAEAEDYAHKLKVAKLRQEAGEKAARAKLSKSALADVRDDLSIPDPEEPKLRRYIANDTSYESLGAMLGDNPNGVLVFRDELVSLLKTLDREDNAGARGFYLTGWSGNSPYTFDRITRGRVSIPAVTLSLLGSTQPGRIAEYIRGAVTGGSGDDGLIQRFGLLVWPDTGGEWREVDRWPDTEARRQAFAVFDRLDTLDPLDLGAAQDADFNGNPDGQPFLRFAPDALEEFRAWREGLEKQLRSGEEHPALESHMAKYRKLAPSLALILHLANGERGHVSRLATEQALGWIEYLSTHARRAYASVSSPETAAAKAIVDRLRRGEIPRVFAPRDIYRKGWAYLSDPKLVHDALTLLGDLDWIFTETRETEGRWAKEYQANPRGFPQ